MSNDKQRARRRARNSQAPDPFRRAFETDSTLRKSTAGEAPSSRRGAASIGAPSSRRGAQAAKRSRDGAGATASKAELGEDALNFDAAPASEKRNGTVSERRPKTTGPDSAVEVAGGRAAVLPGDDVAGASEPSSAGRRAPIIGAVIALVGVAIALLVWRAVRSPEATESSTPTAVEAPAAQAPVIPSVAPVPPPPEVTPPAPTASAATEEPPPEATTKDKKKKKKKTGAPAPTPTAKPTAAPTAAPTGAPAFQFQFD